MAERGLVARAREGGPVKARERRMAERVQWREAMARGGGIGMEVVLQVDGWGGKGLEQGGGCLVGVGLIRGQTLSSKLGLTRRSATLRSKLDIQAVAANGGFLVNDSEK